VFVSRVARNDNYYTRYTKNVKRYFQIFSTNFCGKIDAF